MDSEKIIFIILAIVFSVFSMVRKAKRQKQPLPENLPEDVAEDVENLQKNPIIYSKKEKKKQNLQNLKKEDFRIKSAEIISQDIDSECEKNLLEDFEGSDLQKAFLFSEIFKDVKN
jgi:cell shape-determining protein MreC